MDNDALDELGDKLFGSFVERRARCRAVSLHYENMWDAARWLHQQGYGTKVTAAGGMTVEILRGDQSLFVANVENGDAIIFGGGDNIAHVVGQDFRRIWERDV